MKRLKFAGGILLIALALVLTLLALVFPGNGLFAALWNAGIATFRGVPSFVVIYLASALFLVFGLGLLLSRKKKEGA